MYVMTPAFLCRSDDVRRAVQHGPDRLAALQDRHPADGLGVRRGEHAHHDAHGRARARDARRRRLRQVSPLGRPAAPLLR